MDLIRGDCLPSDDESYPFIGHEEFLNVQVSILCNRQTQILQITGPPMIGKTRTAKLLVRKCLNHLSKDGVRAEAQFVSARRCETMEPILLKLRVIAQCSPSGDLIEHVRAKAKEGVLFLLLDNVEDLIDSDRCKGPYMTLCQDLVNCSPDVKLVTTSRRDIMFPRLSPAQSAVSPLSPLESTAACNLLNMVVNANTGERGTESICIGQKMALEIVDHLGCLPLLVIITGCQIRNRDFQPEEILQLLQDKEEAGILAVTNDERYSPEDRAADILAHFTRMLGTPLKRALANLNEIPGSFSVEAAAYVQGEAYPSLMKQRYLIPLNGRHVLTFDKKENRLDITPVIREFIEKNFVELKDPDVIKRFCSYFQEQFQDILSVYHKDAESAMKEIADDFLKYIKVLRESKCSEPGSFARNMELLQSGESQLIELFPADAESFVRRLVDASASLGDRRQQARLLMAHGSVLGSGLGQHQEASQALRKARELIEGIREETDNNQKSADDIFLLAKVYHHTGANALNLGHQSQALKILKQSQQLLKECERNERNKRLSASNDCLLGMTYTHLGEHFMAEQHHLQALKARKAMWGENHPYVGMVINNLALVYAYQGLWEKALPLFEKGLEIKRQNSGGIATHTVTISMVNVAAGNLIQGNLGMALSMVTEALSMRKELIWKNWVTACLKKVEGKIYMKQGEREAAKAALSEAVNMRRELFGEHLTTSGAIKYLADAEMMCGDYQAAEKHYLEALDMGRRVLKDLPSNFGLADTFMGLARLKMLLRQPENARMYAEQARVELMRIAEVLGEKSARLKNCREKLQEVERFRSDGYTLDSSSTWLQSQQMALDLCNKNVTPQSHDTAYNSLKQTQSCPESDSLNNLDLKIPSSNDDSDEKFHKTCEKFNISSIERLSLDEENNAVAGSMTEHAPALTNDGHLLLENQMSPKISNSCDQMFPTDKSVKNSGITNEVKHSNNGGIQENVTQWHRSRKETRFRTIWRQVAPPTKCRSLESLVSRTWSTSVELPSSIDHPSRIKAVMIEPNANDSAKNDNINSQRDIDNNWCDPARFFAGRRLSASCESLQTNLTLTDREGPPTSRESQRVGIPAFSMLFETSNIGGTPNGDDTNLVMEGGHIVEGSTNYSSKYSQTVT